MTVDYYCVGRKDKINLILIIHIFFLLLWTVSILPFSNYQLSAGIFVWTWRNSEEKILLLPDVVWWWCLLVFFFSFSFSSTFDFDSLYGIYYQKDYFIPNLPLFDGFTCWVWNLIRPSSLQNS